MDDQRISSAWLLEHQGTHEILNLFFGENSIGRHSQCTFRYRFEKLSRYHAVFNVRSNDEISVLCNNAFNGVYVNGDRLNGTERSLAEFDVISVGLCPPDSENVTGARKTVFLLRKRRLPERGEIVMISDDEDDSEEPQEVVLPLPTEPPLLEVVNIKDELIDTNKSNETAQGSCELQSPQKPTELHMPKISKIKEERVQMDSKQIEDVFGDVDDFILEKTKDINPYIFNTLSRRSNNTVQIKHALASGEFIDVSNDCEKLNVKQSKDHNKINRNSPTIVINSDDEEEYFLQSQALLNDIKEELADVDDNDLIEKERNNQILDIILDTTKNMEKVKDNDNLKNNETEKVFLDEVGENFPIIVINSDDEEENFLQSQMLINDIKEELADMNENRDIISNQPLDLDSTKQGEPTFSPTESEESFTCESDEELDLKVNSWTMKLFSQAYEPRTDVSFDANEPEDIKILQLLDDIFDNDLADCNEIRDHVENKVTEGSDINTNQVDNKTDDDTPTVINYKNKPTRLESTSSNNGNADSDKSSLIKGTSFTKQTRLPSTTSREDSSNLATSPNKQNLSSVQIENNYLNTVELKPITRPLNNENICENFNNSVETLTKGIEEIPTTSEIVKDSTIKNSVGNQKKVDKDVQDKNNFQTNKQIHRRYSICTSPFKNSSKLSTDPKKSTHTCSSDNESSTSTRNKPKNVYSSDNQKKTDDGIHVSNNLPNLKKMQRRYSICASPSKNFNKLCADDDVPSSPDDISSASKNKSNNCVKPADFEEPQNQTVAKNSSRVRGLQIIDAPQLPKHRGKLRGVSAAPNVLNRIRAESRFESTVRDLKQKWCTKAQTKRKENKDLKEERKDRLKKLAEADHQESLGKGIKENAKKRHLNSGQVNAKVTGINRGAFLAQEIEQSPSNNTFKKPKLSEKHKTTCIAQTDGTAYPTKSNDVPQRRKHRAMSVDTFSQQIAAPDKIVYQRSNSHQTKLPTERKDAAIARTMRTTNKITFAGMEIFLKEKDKREKRLDEMRNKIANPNGNQIVDVNKENTPTKKLKTAKKVRFNDEPIIYYIEPVRGAFRKVGLVKDFVGMTMSTYKTRRYAVRNSYKFVDYTNAILTDILYWSNQWLEVGNANEIAAKELIMPMAYEFVTYEHYKGVLFPLMKLDFQNNIERSFKLQIKTYKAELETVTRINDRYLLQTKALKVDACKFDLQTIKFGQDFKSTFAYLQCLRNGYGTSCKLIFEILVQNYSQDHLLANKQLTVRPVVDNIRIELEAFNAVYQLKNTPLYKYVIHPNELCSPNPMLLNRKLPDYKAEARKLDEEQKKTLLKTYLKVIDESKPNITLIKGPPGTGKSVIIVNLSLQCLYGSEVRWLDRKILICSQSNTAIDNISVRFKNISDSMKNQRAKFRVVRFGMQEKMSSKAKAISLQHFVEQARKNKVQANLSEENQVNLKQQEIQLEADILALKRRNYQGTSLEQQLEAKHKQLEQIRHLLNNTFSINDEREITKCILENANVICTTLSSCVKLAQYIDYFDVCIIDEATQCTEPWTLLPLKFGMPSLVLVGDTQQLPATVLSKKANDYGLSTSMFARIENCLEQTQSEVIKDIIYNLTTQYRMHPEICKWPSQYFYRNQLKNAETTLTLNSPILPYCLINLKYTTCEQGSNGSITNKLEAQFVSKLISSLRKFIPIESNTYGIISPYALHCETLKAALKNPERQLVTVCTVDSYQGLQRDVIIMSNARTHGLGFLANYQRLNIALTRSRKNLILCGNFQNLEKVDICCYLLKDARDRNLYFEVDKDCADNIESYLIKKLLVTKPQ